MYVDMGMLRKAGEHLRAFDDAYASKILDMYAPEGVKGRGPHAIAGLVLGGFPASKAEGVKASNPPVFPGEQFLAKHIVPYGLPAVSTSIRYGAPAAGVAVAGQGVMGIINTMSANQQSEGAVMPQ